MFFRGSSEMQNPSLKYENEKKNFLQNESVQFFY
jgi:hypothetical protein